MSLATPPERAERIVKSRRVYKMMNNFWKKAPPKAARTVFGVAVGGTILSGLTATVPTKGDIDAIDMEVYKLARPLYRAPIRLGAEDGTVTYKQPSPGHIFSIVKWTGADVELRVQRF
eukprot:6652233-Heterocapsa_arctica.AAC.1